VVRHLFISIDFIIIISYCLESRYSGRVKKVGKLSVARQGLDLLIIVDHGGWVERGGLLHDAINLGKLSTAIVHPAHICVLRILLRL